MNSLTLKSLLAATLLAGAASAVPAQELKIGYVNSDRVLREAVPAKAADQARGRVLQAREGPQRSNRLKGAAASSQGRADAGRGGAPRPRGSSSGPRLQRRRRELEDLSQRKNETRHRRRRANPLHRQIFETEKYDLILQEAVFTAPRSTSPTR
jgi:outer membrane protein